MARERLMSDAELEAWMESPEYARRVGRLIERVRAGEPMTMEYAASELRLPFTVFATIWGEAAVEALAAVGVPAVVEINDRPAVTH